MKNKGPKKSQGQVDCGSLSDMLFSVYSESSQRDAQSREALTRADLVGKWKPSGSL